MVIHSEASHVHSIFRDPTCHRKTQCTAVVHGVYQKGPLVAPKLEERALRQVSVPVKVELGKCEVTMRDVLNLEVGDIVRLDTQAGEELVLCIGDLAKFRCVPGAEGKALAVQITRLISPEEVP